MTVKLTSKPTAADGLKEFRSVLGDFKTLSSLGMKGAAIAPAAALWMHIGLPSPPLIALITSIMVLATQAWVFQSWYQMPPSRLKRRMKLCAAAVAVSFLSFMGLIAAFTVEVGAKGSRVIEGYVVRSDVKPLLGPAYTASNALRDSAYDAAEVWTRGSILTVTLGLESIWIMAFICFAAFLSAFIILQRRKPARAKGSSPQ